MRSALLLPASQSRSVAAVGDSVPPHTRTSGRLRSVAKAGLAIVGVGSVMAMSQVMDLLHQWKTKFRIQASACRGPTEGFVEQRSCQARGAASGATVGSEEAAEPLRPTLLLFLGDSLVSGVGGQVENGEPAAAALPRNVASRLADWAGVQVQWASVGITGADVECLRQQGLPRLREKIAAYKASGSNVVVVLVVGVNDLRKMQLATYRLKLRSLVSELRYIMKDRAVDAVVLPAIRIADAPMLQLYPLRYFAAPLCNLWEREKEKAVRWFSEVKVLPFPSPPSQDRVSALFSDDQMHPSASGYEWWADSLARQIHGILAERHRSILARRSGP